MSAVIHRCSKLVLRPWHRLVCLTASNIALRDYVESRVRELSSWKRAWNVFENLSIAILSFKYIMRKTVFCELQYGLTHVKVPMIYSAIYRSLLIYAKYE